VWTIDARSSSTSVRRVTRPYPAISDLHLCFKSVSSCDSVPPFVTMFWNPSQGTLDYLFHDLLPRGGLQKTAAFIRDRSRAVRNDFTMQHETGRIAMECHDRCVRFHILVMHLERDRPGFSCDMEEQQLMNCTRRPSS
jgi:hypothetical protein